MLKFLLTASVLLTFGVLRSSAKIWRVNNNAGVTANFTDVQPAHDAAASGDTIHIEGSPDSYGSLTCRKKLVILGPGYFLVEHPNTQLIANSSILSGISFNVGSEGSIIMGLDLRSGLYVYCNDIIISRNKFSSPNGNIEDYYFGNIYVYYQSNNSSIPVNNVIITQNFGVSIHVSYASTGILITNNYIGAGVGNGGNNAIGLNASQKAILLVQNNIFRRGIFRSYNSTFTNNIMVEGSAEGSGNLVSNNLSNASQFGTESNNKANVDMSTVFIGAGSGISTDGQWKLKAGSPAIGAGYGSTSTNPIDAGLFSGQTPYVLAGQPPMPAIYAFENQPIGSNTDPIDVKVKVKSVGN